MNLSKNILPRFFYKKQNIAPYIENNVGLSIFHGVIIFLFLNIFKPFNLDNLNEYFFNYSLIMGVISILVPLLHTLFIKYFINFYNWNFGNTTVVIIIYLFIYSFCVWFIGGVYKDNYGLNRLSYFLVFVYATCVSLISFPIMTLLKKVIEEYNIHKRLKKNNQEITIYSENNKESLMFEIKDLLYISIEGNYTSFFLNKENTIIEKVIRNTLSKVEKQITINENLFRCHKSYIVNLLLVDKITGNTKGYFFETNISDVKIPVSRKYSKVFLQGLLTKGTFSSQKEKKTSL